MIRVIHSHKNKKNYILKVNTSILTLLDPVTDTIYIALYIEVILDMLWSCIAEGIMKQSSL